MHMFVMAFDMVHLTQWFAVWAEWGGIWSLRLHLVAWP